MKQEDKNLLLQDLCARLPYGVKIRIEYPFLKEEEWHPEILYGLDLQRLCIANTSIRLEEFKAYLFSISSMTDEQKEDLLLTVVGKEGLKLFSVTKDGIISNNKAEQSFENFSLNSINFSNKNIEAYIEWLNKKHFDYRGLIEKGLAIDCTNLNIY